MKVVCVLKTNAGGLWTVPQMEEVRRRGHDVVYVIPPGDGALRQHLAASGLEFVPSHFDFDFTPSWRLIQGLVALRRQLKTLGAEVVIYHLYASALAVRLSSLGTGIRRVHMVAGPLYLDSPAIRMLERLLCRLDGVLIGGSKHTTQRYLELGMPPTRVETIAYGVDLARYSTDEALPEKSLNHERFTAIMVSYVYAPKLSVHRGCGIKGHEVLLEAWRMFAEGRSDVELIILGAGNNQSGEKHRETLMQRYSFLGPQVRWVDTVDDVRPWYLASDISISPSLSENHGAALEAGAMRRPSIVSDAGALPETVLPDVSGWIVPAGSPEALVMALREAHLAWRTGRLTVMGAAARTHVQTNFDQGVCTRRVADLLLGESYDEA